MRHKPITIQPTVVENLRSGYIFRIATDNRVDPFQDQ